MPPTMPTTVPGPMLGRHLGRKPPTDEMRKRALPLRNFIKLAGRPVPPTDDYATQARAALRTMMGNDQQGDCVAADLCKRVGVMNAYRPGGKVLTATTAEALAFYHAVGGPGDNGLYMPDAFDYWRDKGIKIGGALHKIEGYASFDITDSALFDAACHWFLGVDLGVALTRDQYMNADDSDVWDIDNSGVVGGHAIPLTVRGPDKCKIATWGAEPSITRRLLHSRNWCDEAYVVVSAESFADGIDVNAVNLDALRAALAAIKAGGTPDIPPDPNPPTPPVPPVGPGNVQLTGFVNMFGQLLPTTMQGTFTQALAGLPTGAGFLTILTDIAALLADFRAKDFAQMWSDALKLLADLGIVLTVAEMAQLHATLGAALVNAPAWGGDPLGLGFKIDPKM